MHYRKYLCMLHFTERVQSKLIKEINNNYLKYNVMLLE